jgi:mono/diheme cytochrome c family protein
MRSAVSLFVLSVTLTSAVLAQSDEPVQYNRDIRPILSQNCFACHGPDSASRKGELRLDQRDAAIASAAITPNKPEESSLVERIFSTDPDMQMPPASAHKTLKPEEKEILKKWVAQGAEYQKHWSLIAPVKPAVPEVKDKSWPKSPIDAFILTSLEKNGLTPAPEADRRTLARRVSLDLVGLPPNPADVEAFVNDQAPNAYEKYVDKLLESKQWGEHRARYWLDAARYADTHGIHFDNYREIWAYRDWVIKAYNANMPFDQFTTEQLAGDLLPNPTLDQRIASGFNRCNITTNEGGIIDEEYLVLYTRDRTETAAQVWMGSTAGCAVCHDHKFDPISQREFYELAAFFNNSNVGARDGNIKDPAPTVAVPMDADRERFEALKTELAETKATAEKRKAEARGSFDEWLKTTTPDSAAAQSQDGLVFLMPLDEGAGEVVKAKVRNEQVEIKSPNLRWAPGHVSDQAYKADKDQTIELAAVGDFERDQPFSYGCWIRLEKGDMGGAVFARMNDQAGFRGWDMWMEGGRVGGHIINQWPDDALKSVARDPVPTGRWVHVLVTYDGSSKAEGIKVYYDGESKPMNITTNSLKNTIKTETPWKLAQRHTTARMNGLQIQDVRFFEKNLSPVEVKELATGARARWLVAKPADKRTPPEVDELYAWWLPARDEAYRGLIAKQGALEGEDAAIRARGTVAHVMSERNEEATAFVLFRGDYDKRKDQVKAKTPAILPPMSEDLPRNRLGLAKWLLSPEHPLTARVNVNRFWQEVFGTGLVKTSGDFGVTGELPSHPELLDYLAIDFRENGWNMKRFYRNLVLSSTYRQAAQITPEKLEKDRDNRLLSRGPRFRMDAEMVRDYALAASGLLKPIIGGPSVKPYQPDGVWEAVAMIGSDTRDYKRDTGDKLYRRSMYTFLKRAAPPASMEIFNATARETCTVRRERTNTPLQALVTLNDVQFVEAARHLATLALQSEAKEDAAKIDFIAQRLLARPLRPEESAVVTKSLEQLRAFYVANESAAKLLIAEGESKAPEALDAKELAAWTMLTNELMNLDEVLNK